MGFVRACFVLAAIFAAPLCSVGQVEAPPTCRIIFTNFTNAGVNLQLRGKVIQAVEAGTTGPEWAVPSDLMPSDSIVVWALNPDKSVSLSVVHAGALMPCGHSVWRLGVYPTTIAPRKDKSDAKKEEAPVEISERLERHLVRMGTGAETASLVHALATEQIRAVPMRLFGADSARGFFVDDFGIVFRRIEAGTFVMGASPDPMNLAQSVRVQLTKPFWLADAELTQAQTQIMAQIAGQPEVRGLRERPVTEANTVAIDVSWAEADALCTSHQKRAMYRLPTEAEWEYACRSGSGKRFCFGDDPAMMAQYGWVGQYSTGRPKPIRSLRANSWGLYDMHGNVREWCSDWYTEVVHKPDAVLVDPTGGTREQARVTAARFFSGPKKCLRGSDYTGTLDMAACASRGGLDPDAKGAWYAGARLAMVEPPKDVQVQKIPETDPSKATPK